MDLFVLMQRLEAEQDLSHDEGANPFWYLFEVLINDISKCSSVHVLDKHEEAVHVVVGGVVVDDVGVGAHAHHSSLDLDLVQNVLLWHLHHSHCPSLIGILSVKGLIDGAHGSLAELLGKAIKFIGVIRQEYNLLDLLVELAVCEQRIIGNFLLGLETGDDLYHDLWVFLDEVVIYAVFVEELHHIGSESFDSAGTVEIHLQVHLMLEVFRPE